MPLTQNLSAHADPYPHGSERECNSRKEPSTQKSSARTEPLTQRVSSRSEPYPTGSEREYISRADGLMRWLPRCCPPSPLPTAAIQRGASSDDSAILGGLPPPKGSSLPPEASLLEPPTPPEPKNMPRGPLELPDKAHRDSDSEDSSDEERDPRLDEQRAPHFRVVPHIIYRRLAKAAHNEIMVDWCNSISYKVYPDEVHALCVYRIETERLRLGGSRFKVGITHSPRWRFIDAPYAYLQESVPWGSMRVLWVSAEVDFACDLEKSLIEHYKTVGTPGRMNQKNGGDSAPKFGPCFVYCVFGCGPRGGSDKVRELYRQRRVRSGK